nr:predicted GPI-anchored protein 58 [Lolium perenne]
MRPSSATTPPLLPRVDAHRAPALPLRRCSSCSCSTSASPSPSAASAPATPAPAARTRRAAAAPRPKPSPPAPPRSSAAFLRRHGLHHNRPSFTYEQPRAATAGSTPRGSSATAAGTVYLGYLPPAARPAAVKRSHVPPLPGPSLPSAAAAILMAAGWRRRGAVERRVGREGRSA